MQDTVPNFDRQTLESMNEKVIQNQFFTPDKVYIDLKLFKDIPLGIIYTDQMMQEDKDEKFPLFQKDLIPYIPEYQKRKYDTIDLNLTSLGYTDIKVEALLKSLNNDVVFALSPTTQFLNLLIRHTIRNQNNSRPAAKYVKTMIDKDQYVMSAIPVTYYFNTFPLNLSKTFLESLGQELGESLGVDIQFLHKDPKEFDQTDWDSWMKNIDCFYLDSLGQFTRSPTVLQKQADLEFMGTYFFARKRFEKCVMQDMINLDFDQQVQMATAQLDIFCDFAWIQNNDLRLTEEKEDVSAEDDFADQVDRTAS